MKRLIAFSLLHPWGMVVLAALTCVAGLSVSTRVNVDVFPDLDRPGVTVMTHIPGLSPDETEARLTRPIEAALAGTPGVEEVWSSSSIGLSHVHVVFGWSADQARARELVGQRLQVASSQLPKGALPVLLPFVSVMGEVELVSLSNGSGPARSAAALRSLADTVVRPRLLSIAGVAQVLVIGGDVQELGVQVDPAKLLSAGVTLADVRRAVAQVGQIGTGGILPYDNQEYLVRLLAPVEGGADIASAVVRGCPAAAATACRPVRVSDVAIVAPQAILKRGSAGVNGGPGVILSVYKAPGEDTRRISRDISEALQQVEPQLPAGLRVDRLFKQADFIDAAVGNVLTALREAAVLVIFVLLAFLASARASAITLTALPVSLLTTVLVLNAFGISLNTLTLGGLAVAVGELVDDAIVDVENVWRRLRENRALAVPRPVLQVVFSASLEVRSSILYATLVVVLAVVPLALLSGIEGRLFQPLVVAYILSVAVSLLVSLTLTPALCALLLGNVRKGLTDAWLVRWLKRLDARALGHALGHPGWVLGGAALLCALAVFSLRFTGREFLPAFNEGTLTVNVIAVPGITLDDSDRIGSLAERLLLEVPEVVRTGRRTGRAELDTHSAGVHYSEIEVALRPGRPRAVLDEEIRKRLSALPGVVVYLGQPISHRLEHLLEGMNGQIVVRLFGPDPDRLRELAEQARRTMAAIPGIVDLQTEKQLLIPELNVAVDRAWANALGLNAGDVAEQAQQALYGEVAGRAPLAGVPADIRVVLDPAARRDPDALRALNLVGPQGSHVALGQVAEVREAAGQDYLNHDRGERFIAVTANVQGQEAGQVAAAVEQDLGTKLVLPSGYRVAYGGVWRAQQRAQRSILLFSALAVALIAIALLWHFRSIALTLQTLANIPLSLVGSAAALLIFREKLSVATAVGFVTVCGIASRNTILLISHYLHLMEHEGEVFGRAMVVRGSLERLPPMLMTALTAGLAVLPLILGRDQPGKEILGPVAIVIAGGLVSSTLLDLVVTPVAFLWFGRDAAAARLARQQRTAGAAEDTVFPGAPA